MRGEEREYDLGDFVGRGKGRFCGERGLVDERVKTSGLEGRVGGGAGVTARGLR